MSFHSKPNTFVAKVSLKVQNLERSIAFYEQLIGFKVLERTEAAASFTADGKTALLTIEQPARVIPKKQKTTGLYHFALLLPDRADLAAIVRHLANAGLRFGSSDHLVSEALYMNDPDGNGIEIYRDRPAEQWNWHDKEVAMAVDPLNFAELLAAEPRSWTGLPADTVMGHIHLHVSDLAAAEKFYTQGLGFDVVNRFGEQALFVSTGGYHHHIGLNTWAGVGAPQPPAESVGLESFTLVLPDEAARIRTVTQLEQVGASVVREADGRFMVADPAGNRIQLQV